MTTIEKHNKLTLKNAKNYILDYFEYNDEARSYSHELTDNGVFTKKDVQLFDADNIVNVANDIKYSFYSEFGHMLGQIKYFNLMV